MYKGYRRGTSCKYANNTFCLQCTGKQVVISRQEKEVEIDKQYMHKIHL